jgi:iron complex transport system substrate-binding protein
MRRVFSLLIVFSSFILLYSCGNQTDENAKANDNNGLTIVDDLNDTLRFEDYPKKIVSLAPNLTEMIYALKSENKLIANTTFCNFPEDAKSKEKIGDLFSIDYEKIIALKPDLILMTVEGNNKGSYEKLNDLNFKAFVSNPRDYEGIINTFSDMGKLTGKTTFADSLISVWNEKFEKIKSESLKRERKKALLLISLNPLISASGKTFINEYLKYCNLANIAEDSPVNYPVFNREEILKRDPEIIIVQQNISKDDLLTQFPEWKNLSAIKNNMIIEIDPDLYFRPGPRFIEALEDLNEQSAAAEQ